jgi:hypothetical protein
MSRNSPFWEAFDKIIEGLTVPSPPPPPPPRRRPRSEQPQNADARLRSKHEVQLNRLLGDARRALHQERDASQRAVDALNHAFARAKERWPEMPGVDNFGDAYQGKTLAEAVNYAVYLIGLLGPVTEAGREPTTAHVFDSDGSRRLKAMEGHLRDAETQQRADEQTIVKQARRIEELENKLGSTLKLLDSQKAERRIDEQGQTWSLLSVGKIGSRYEATITTSNGSESGLLLGEWLKWRKA